MRRTDQCPSGVDLFWEDADLNDSAEHPLVRELAHRLDVLMRYQRLINDALGDGSAELLSNLTQQHDRQLQVIEQLQAALRRHDMGGDGAQQIHREHTDNALSAPPLPE